MIIILAIAVVHLVALGIYGLDRHCARGADAGRDLLRAGQHPAPAAYQPGAAYSSTAGVTGGGAA
jgi:hypothetical protein